MTTRRRAIVAAALVAGWAVARCGGHTTHTAPRAPQPLRFATFNIENFPKDSAQVTGAFDEIAALDASFVAVQEISDPALFRATARRRLGAAWDFISIDTSPADTDAEAFATHHVGVLYDRDLYRVAGVTSHDDTRAGRHKPTLEVVLRPRADAPDVRVFVVHLKSGGDHRDVRARQLAGLGQLLRRTRADHPRDRVVVLGDFNATDDGDRADIAAVAAGAGLTWATEPLACTAFWDRDDGCETSRLDHVLTWAPPADVHATGGCATHGCARRDSCPLYADAVSDHCPVVVTIGATATNNRK